MGRATARVVGAHYSKAGELRFLSGRQFRSVMVTNVAALTPAEAVDRALSRLASLPGFRPEAPGIVTPEVRSRRVVRTSLRLVPVGDTMRFAYFTVANDEAGAEQEVVIDAATEAILAVTPTALSSNCQPTQPAQSFAATGVPVRPELRGTVSRAIKANRATDRPGYSYEGFYAGTPTVSVVQETGTTGLKCAASEPKSYTLFPLTSTVYQDNASVPEWKGYRAGDAMYHTKETMAAFATLGRNGWSGVGSDANIAIESSYNGATADNAYFTMNAGGSPLLPPTPAVYLAPAGNYYSEAASLDVVAHEWGHGVIFSSANFPTSTAVGLQMHEGWADTVGQTVEKLRQPSGSGLEHSSDWTLHEDSGTAGYARGALDDGAANGSQSCCHTWTNLSGGVLWFNDTLHRQDEPTITESHARGNMMNVVLRLLTEGGKNPICTRQPTFAGCTLGTGALGLTAASQILFDTLQFYTPSTAQWADLATYASQAAFDLYSNCSNIPPTSATGAQNSVSNAFGAIGYPRTTAAYQCQ